MARPPSNGRRKLIGGLGAAACWPAWAQQADATREDKGPPPPALGTRLAVPDATLLDGQAWRAAQSEGQVLVLYWWASWCPFCAQQSPLMNQLWLGHKDRGLRMLGLSIDRRAEDASSYLIRRGYSFPSAWVTPEMARALPKPRGLPVSLVRGRDGRVLAAESGQLFPEDIEAFARFL